MTPHDPAPDDAPPLRPPPVAPMEAMIRVEVMGETPANHEVVAALIEARDQGLVRAQQGPGVMKVVSYQNVGPNVYRVTTESKKYGRVTQNVLVLDGLDVEESLMAPMPPQPSYAESYVMQSRAQLDAAEARAAKAEAERDHLQETFRLLERYLVAYREHCDVVSNEHAFRVVVDALKMVVRMATEPPK